MESTQDPLEPRSRSPSLKPEVDTYLQSNSWVTNTSTILADKLRSILYTNKQEDQRYPRSGMRMSPDSETPPSTACSTPQLHTDHPGDSIATPDSSNLSVVHKGGKDESHDILMVEIWDDITKIPGPEHSPNRKRCAISHSRGGTSHTKFTDIERLQAISQNRQLAPDPHRRDGVIRKRRPHETGIRHPMLTRSKTRQSRLTHLFLE